MQNVKLIGPFTQLLPLDNLPTKGAISDHELEIISDAGILVEAGKIKKVDSFHTLRKENPDCKIEYITTTTVCLPGFIDAHTHICFAGTRAQDYALRNSGKTYLEIAKAGGGIWDTVTQTRKADSATLVNGILERTTTLLENGVTTIEVKSGYGLSVPQELKMLRAIKEANEKTAATLISTCLAAHMLPKDYPGTKAAYLHEIANSLFPMLQQENLTHRIDAFIETSAFSKEDIIPYFKHAKKLGFDITVHADQFSTSGSEIAVKFGALSADHLEASTTTEIQLLAQSKVIATALPGASIGLGCNFTPARQLLDAGVSLAIASDWNPGSAPMGDLLTQAAILGTFEKLTAAEIFAGITSRAANALNLDDRGILKPEYTADFVVFPTADYKEILYRQGRLKPSQVWKNGKTTFNNSMK